MIIFNQNVKAIPFKLSGGEKSATEACQIIKQLAHHFKKNPVIRNLAVNLVYGLPSHDYFNEVRKIFDFVQCNIRYVKDIKGCETLQTPLVTLPLIYSDQGIGSGDCDDHVILLATLLLAIGVKGLKMRIVKYRPEQVEYVHIYLVWDYKGQSYAMDAINKTQPFGWEVLYAVKKDIPL